MIKSDVFDRDVPRSGCLAFQTITDSFRSHWHSHPDYEIVYIQKGVAPFNMAVYFWNTNKAIYSY